ncbi:MAG TPA: hypothetical protein VMU15_12605 [Anaeromyxobacter sp.]|nr:hypothetical protein [Anaeromyxobacter sp.]
MKTASNTKPDPALQRLHEVADRIRRRSEFAARLARPRGGRGQRGIPDLLPAPVLPPPPRHWADDREPDAEERH